MKAASEEVEVYASVSSHLEPGESMEPQQSGLQGCRNEIALSSLNAELLIMIAQMP